MGTTARPFIRSAITFLAVTGTVAVTLAATTAGVAAASSGDGSSVTHTYSSAQQSASASYWTSSAMASAAGVSAGPMSDTTTPPVSIPNPTYFNGIKTVGALFFTTGTGDDHFCTASVVNSATLDLVLTAAHCVAYGDDTFAQDVVYVPEWHNGVSPYGAWPVENITVVPSWDQNQDDVNADFAFLRVAPPAGTSTPVQLVTGGLTLGSNLGYDHSNIQVIGYNDTDSQPIICTTQSFYAMPDQEEFYCNNYNDGTSGGPWIIGLNPVTGSGVVFGDIGGYDQGGDYPWYSYSPYYNQTIDLLYAQAQVSQL